MRQSLAVAVLALFSTGECGYFGITTQNSYRESEKICQSQGGVLASFHSDTEYAYAEAECEYLCNTYDAFSDRCGCWVGVLDWGKEGNWKFEDRSTKEYVMSSAGSANTGVWPWSSGEPNNYVGDNARGEDCVHIWKAQGYEMNDMDCNDHSYYAVCEENTKEYFSIQGQFDYAEAAKECREEGGVLASFHDDTEFTTAQTICQQACDTLDAGNADCGCWIGLKDKREEYDWHWEDQSFKNYVMLRTGKATPGAPWYPGEPNNSGDEDCVQIWKAQGYLLNDIDCSDTNFAICTRYVPNRMPPVGVTDKKLAASTLVVGETSKSMNTLTMIGAPVAAMVVGALAYVCHKSKKTDENKQLLSHA